MLYVLFSDFLLEELTPDTRYYISSLYKYEAVIHTRSTYKTELQTRKRRFCSQESYTILLSNLTVNHLTHCC